MLFLFHKHSSSLLGRIGLKFRGFLSVSSMRYEAARVNIRCVRGYEGGHLATFLLTALVQRFIGVQLKPHSYYSNITLL